MEAKSPPLGYVVLAALACYGASVLPVVPRVVSSATGSILCFILVGVALASAILPYRVSAIARLAALIGCALGAGMLGGFLLNSLPTGPSQFNWVTYSLAVTLIAATVARARGADGSMQWTHHDIRMPSKSSLVKVLAAGLLVIATVVTATTSWNNEETITEVWLVPDSPGRSPVDAKNSVLGIKSHESTNEDFVVVVNNGTRITSRTVSIAPEQVWTLNIPLEGTEAVASVYRGGSVSNRPYRTVWVVTH